MRNIVVRNSKEFEAGFDRIRRELDIADNFPPEVLAAAREAQLAQTPRYDARHMGFIAVDPPGATDLDQAFFATREGAGFTMYYAIADVGAFIKPGGLVDQEARRRGATMYSPDRRSPLHPADLSEDRASLLPGQERPALLWTFELDIDGEPTSAKLERSTVKVSEAISYSIAQDRIDEGTSETLLLLKEIGLLRQEREAQRGGISLSLPAQEISNIDDHYKLAFDRSLPVEGWNAQMSLLAGMTAGKTMVEAGVGILRTLPPPHEQNIERLRLTAQALSIGWPQNLSYPDFIRTLDPNDPASNALMVQATRTFRGAGYEGFDGETPEQPTHGAISSLYSHVTAPLRRLVDRFGNEILLAIYGEHAPPGWALEALDELPAIMTKTKQRESALDRSILNFGEALILDNRIGERFRGLVVDLSDDGAKATVQIAEPAVVADISGDGRSLAETVDLQLTDVDIETSKVRFDVTSGRN